MSFYPDLTYPTAPGFPTGHDDVPIGPDLYKAIMAYIGSLVTETTTFLDRLGNLKIGAAKGIEWDDTIRINLTGGEIKVTALQINTQLTIDTPTLTTITITDDLIISNDLVFNPSTDIAVTGTVTQDYVDRGTHRLTQAAEPGDPADNNAVLWISNGTGAGDAGDFMCKITEGGGTSTFTISDYSAL